MLVAGRGKGVVTEFDELAGLGTISRNDGVALPFHCMAIADGSRTIDVGVEVAYRVCAAQKGRIEAIEVEKL